jgi:hypothetical protein
VAQARCAVTIKLVYIAGPYRAATAWQCEQNIREAEVIGYRVAQLGAYPVIPHSNTRAYFESAQADPEFWLGGTLELMRKCDGALFLPRWMESSGARLEHTEARRLHMPMFGVGHLDDGRFERFVRGEDFR